MQTLLSYLVFGGNENGAKEAFVTSNNVAQGMKGIKILASPKVTEFVNNLLLPDTPRVGFVSFATSH
jgi:hypothetical protein